MNISFLVEKVYHVGWCESSFSGKHVPGKWRARDGLNSLEVAGQVVFTSCLPAIDLAARGDDHSIFTRSRHVGDWTIDLVLRDESVTCRTSVINLNMVIRSWN
jgi:hypothetical protein